MARPRNEVEYGHTLSLYCNFRTKKKRRPNAEELYRLHKVGCPTATTARWMRHNKWLDEFEETYQTMPTGKEEPFELHLIDDYDIHSDEIEDVAYIWTTVRQQGVNFTEVYAELREVIDVYLPAPSVRMVEWWARVMRMCPSLKLKAGVERIKNYNDSDMDSLITDPKYWAALDVFAVAGAYHTRDLQNVMFQKNLTFEDFDGCLAFAPWVEADKYVDPASRYIRAIDSEVVPSLRPFNPKDMNWLVKLFSEMNKWLPKETASIEGQRAAVEQYLQLGAWPQNFYIEWTQAELVKLIPTVDPKKVANGFAIGDIDWSLPSRAYVLRKRPDNGP